MPIVESNQPALSSSLIRIFTGYILDSQGCKVFHAENEDSDHTAQIRRLITVSFGRTCQKVRFTTLTNKFYYHLDVWEHRHHQYTTEIGNKEIYLLVPTGP